MSRTTSTLAAITCLAAAFSVGCAERRGAPAASARATPLPAAVTRPAGKDSLTLDEITPRPVLERASTRPAADVAPPPVDALVLYAKARGEMQENRRQSAIRLLEQAVVLDPNSYELNYTLGRAYRGALHSEERSIEQMEKAAALEPEHLDVQLDLGRQYLAKTDVAKSLYRLRLAVQTPDYRADDPRAAEAELFLANALQADGYDRAALSQYERLLARLSDGAEGGAGNELSFAVGGKLYLQVGDLYLRQRQPDKALAAYEKAASAAAGEPGTAGVAAISPAEELDIQSRIINTLLALGRREDAVARAASVVARSRANPESLALLRDVYRAVGRDSGLTTELARLHAERPDDRAILFALADLLRADGRPGDADAALAKASAESPADADIVRRRFASREAAKDACGAASVLVEALAREPGLSGELQESITRLIRTENRERFDPASLLDLPTDKSPAATAAKHYVHWRVLQAWPRRTAARAAGESAEAAALAARPMFAPTLRDRLHVIWSDPNRSQSWMEQASNALAERIGKAADPALADELRARAKLYQGDSAGALELLKRVTKPGGDAAPDRLHALAIAFRGAGDEVGYERQLAQLITRHPLFGPAYRDLHDHQWAQGQAAQAERITAAWLDADPKGLESRLMQVQDHLRLARPEAAELSLAGLFRDFGDDPRVLAAMQMLYARTGRTPRLLTLLEGRVAEEPLSFDAAAKLAQLYLASSRVGDASRVLDAARESAGKAGEADALYGLAHLYAEAGQRETSEAVYEQILKIDPAHASAANDLGYGLADRGEDLPRAEALTRQAVAAEPQSPTLLDSLAWVLYKRGKFAEARDLLERATAIEPGAERDAADPVVLDHLGDVLYRLNDRDAAGKCWDRTARRLAAMGLSPTTGPASGPATVARPSDAGREDLKALRLHLAHKQRQLQAGQPVDVAAIVETTQPALTPAATTRPVEAGAAGRVDR